MGLRRHAVELITNLPFNVSCRVTAACQFVALLTRLFIAHALNSDKRGRADKSGKPMKGETPFDAWKWEKLP